jgi:hypothetical protein
MLFPLVTASIVFAVVVGFVLCYANARWDLGCPPEFIPEISVPCGVYAFLNGLFACAFGFSKSVVVLTTLCGPLIEAGLVLLLSFCVAKAGQYVQRLAHEAREEALDGEA